MQHHNTHDTQQPQICIKEYILEHFKTLLNHTKQHLREREKYWNWSLEQLSKQGGDEA